MQSICLHSNALMIESEKKSFQSLCQQHGRAELRADYYASNTATRVRLWLQVACFDAYMGVW